MKIISVFNQKGGVGKTTTVVNLAAALGLEGKKVLIVDMDPQGNSTSGVGIDKTSLEKTVYDLVIGNEDIKDLILKTEEDNVKIVPSNVSLSGAEVEMVNIENRESILKKSLGEIDGYDYILIDCPPSLGVLSINALTASDTVLIPIQCEYYALEGVSQLISTIDLVKMALNPKLEVEGILMCMFDGRNNLSLEVVEEVKKYFKNQVFKSVIPRNIKLAEAPSHGTSVLKYDDKSKGAIAYKRLSLEIIEKNKSKEVEEDKSDKSKAKEESKKSEDKSKKDTKKEVKETKEIKETKDTKDTKKKEKIEKDTKKSDTKKDNKIAEKTEESPKVDSLLKGEKLVRVEEIDLNTDSKTEDTVEEVAEEIKDTSSEKESK